MYGLYRVDNLIACTTSILCVIQDQIAYRALVKSCLLYRVQSTSALQCLESLLLQQYTFVSQHSVVVLAIS